MRTRIESLFISHGAPTFAQQPGAPGRALGEVGQALLAQGTRALIVLSPHWRTENLAVTSHASPVIVHDFHGFPAALYALSPEIPGAPELAAQLARALRGLAGSAGVSLREQQGFDHGAWVPYLHLFPNGGPPMVQLAMPVDWDSHTAWKVGTVVGNFAREHGAVVVGSGSLTHNFGDMDLRQPAALDIPGYVPEFTAWVKDVLQQGLFAALADAPRDAPHFERAHPDDDHYLPLPFAAAAAGPQASASALPEEVRYRALSMQSVVFG
ncbi:MAG TPA: class III extradiol ring-cleavage dioxygenase [Limnobacter sp.]|nr:class III extradiol ring-cleavage dioxygenase [Limnobacter sp.]